MGGVGEVLTGHVFTGRVKETGSLEWRHCHHLGLSWMKTWSLRGKSSKDGPVLGYELVTKSKGGVPGGS